MKTGWSPSLLVVGGTAATLLGLLSHSHPSPSAGLWEMISPRTAAVVLLMLLMLAAEILALLVLGDRLFNVADQWIGRLAGIPNVLEAIALLGLATILFSFLYSVDYWGWIPGLLISAGLCLIATGLLALTYRAVPAGRLRVGGGKVAAALIGFGLAIVAGEIVLQKLRVDAYRLQPALLKWKSLAAPGAMPGVTGVSHFTTESHGIRGEPYAADKYNILAIGGSTTENLYLDDRENWSYLVQRKLGRTAEGRPVWIGNIGVSGQASPHHLYALRYFVPQLRMDAVIVVVGVNDLIIGLNQPDAPMLDPEDPENRTALMRRTFKQIPLSAKPFPGNLATWSLVEGVREKLRLRVSQDMQDNRGDIFAYRRRLYRKLTKEIDRLPDLTSFLDYYEHNLIALVREARRQRVRLILVTQPSIWHEPMSEESKRLLWMGVEGRWERPEARFSVDVLVRGMALVNQRLLKVCAEQQVECVDLAGAMNGQEDFFFDDVHFTELGSRRVADLVVDYLVQRQPFASPRA